MLIICKNKIDNLFCSGFFVYANPKKVVAYYISASIKWDKLIISILNSNSSQSVLLYENDNSTTVRPYYPDTFSPGSILGIIVSSVVFIIVISISAYFIRRQRLYYVRYYNNTNPV